MGQYKSVARRLREEGLKKYNTMAQFATALELMPESLDNYLNGKIRPGIILQRRLREVGCNLDYIMTGKTSEPQNSQWMDFGDGARVHICPPQKPTPELRLKFQGIIDWMRDNPNADKDALEKMLGEKIGAKPLTDEDWKALNPPVDNYKMN
jgi:transcriptional regulator with XRE-family HTH domain